MRAVATGAGLLWLGTTTSCWSLRDPDQTLSAILDHRCVGVTEFDLERSLSSVVQVFRPDWCWGPVSDPVRIDLQAALERYIATIHPRWKDFVTTKWWCMSSSHMAVPLFRAPALLVFQILRIGRLSSGCGETSLSWQKSRHGHLSQSPLCYWVSAVYDPVTKHFILAASDEQESTRTVVFAVFTLRYEFVGACHWTRVTKVWTLTCYNQRLGHHRVSVHHGDYTACYEQCKGLHLFQAVLLPGSLSKRWLQ